MTSWAFAWRAPAPLKKNDPRVVTYQIDATLITQISVRSIAPSARSTAR